MQEYSKRYYQENKEHHNQLTRNWYKKNKQRRQELDRAWHKNNPDKSAAIYRRYQQTHPENVRTISRNRRAKIKQAEGTHTADDILRQYEDQNGKCFYCDTDLSGVYHVDHVIPLSKGGSNDPSNLVCACPACNLSKNDRTPDEWLNLT